MAGPVQNAPVYVPKISMRETHKACLIIPGLGIILGSMMLVLTISRIATDIFQRVKLPTDEVLDTDLKEKVAKTKATFEQQQKLYEEAKKAAEDKKDDPNIEKLKTAEEECKRKFDDAQIEYELAQENTMQNDTMFKVTRTVKAKLHITNENWKNLKIGICWFVPFFPIFLLKKSY